MALPKGIEKPSARERKPTPLRWTEKLEPVLRHPMTLVIVGFILTAGIGGLIQNVQHEFELQRAETEDAKAAVRGIQAAVDELISRERMYLKYVDEVRGQALIEPRNEALVKATMAIETNSRVIDNAFPLHSTGKGIGAITLGFDHLTNEIWKILDLKDQQSVDGLSECADRFLISYNWTLSENVPRIDRLQKLLDEVQGNNIAADGWATGGSSDCPYGMPRLVFQGLKTAEGLATSEIKIQSVINFLWDAKER